MNLVATYDESPDWSLQFSCKQEAKRSFRIVAPQIQMLEVTQKLYFSESDSSELFEGPMTKLPVFSVDAATNWP